MAFATLAFVAIALWSAHSQTATRIFGDAKEYHQMAQQVASGSARVQAEGPFVFRILTPWLAASATPLVAHVIPPWLDRAIEDSSGLKGVPGFFFVNLLAALATVLLLTAYLRCFIASPLVRFLVVALWLSQWHAPARFVFFNPVNVEPIFLATLIASLLAMEKSRDRPAWVAALWVAPLVLVGTLCRESMALVAVVFAAHRSWVGPDPGWRGGRAVFLLLPACAWALAMALTRQVGVATNGDHPWAEPLRIAQTKPVFTWVLAWFFTFGPPSIALILSAPRETRDFLRGHRHLATLLAGCGVLAFAGTTDSERILGWASPVVLVLLGRAIERHGGVLSRAPVLVALLIVVHLGSSRLLWPVPIGVEARGACGTIGSLLALVVPGVGQDAGDRELLHQPVVLLRQPYDSRGGACL